MSDAQQAPAQPGLPPLIMQMDLPATDLLIRGLAELPLKDSYQLFNTINAARERYIEALKKAAAAVGTSEEPQP